jgi:NADPH:quinone reductase-like Zn-dependent oxidoreductase
LKAAVYTEYGGPEVIKIRDIDKPVPKEYEVLVKIKACSVNDWDYEMLRGTMWLTRMMNGRKKPRVTILGSDVAGTVEAVGPNVTTLKVGDDVFGDLSGNGNWGGFAEYVCAREELLAVKSPKMSFEQAAAIPQAAMLAVQGLHDVGKMKKGQEILVNGAGGGVGTFGIQLAKHLGVEATGVDSGMKLEMLREMGYDHVIDYKKEDFTKTGRKYDLVLDAKTNRSVFSYIRALKPGGIYATVGGDIGKLLMVFLLGGLMGLVTAKKIRIVALKPNKDLEFMKKMFDIGVTKPVIDGPYKLDEIREAFAKFGRGEHKGKIVIVM